ncbi:MAG: hypothetical protein AMXMBFR4_04610 [Candidatus Hydrogenedentota bacterium]
MDVMPQQTMTAVDQVLAYHEATKHHFNRYARSPGFLDWANQPDPFRRYHGAPEILLPLLERDASPPYDWLFTPSRIDPAPFTIQSVGLLFECSLAISAWKEYKGERWALRCNPSSGNLHPTEGYLVAGPVPCLNDVPAVYHYAPDAHALEVRAEFRIETWRALRADFPVDTMFVGLSSVHWREAWKYGERAYRYCQHDAGHAMAAIRMAAAMLGWRATYLEALADETVAALLGLDREADFHDRERESPDMLIAVYTGDCGPHRTLPLDAVRQIAAGVWRGKANRLSDEHVVWPAIDEVNAACRKPDTAEEIPHPPTAPKTPAGHDAGSMSAYRIVQQRRSAVAMDGVTSIGRAVFYRMLDRVVPTLTAIPWDMLALPVTVHLGLFVHRVDGVPPGLYCLARDRSARHALQSAMKSGFCWQTPPECPDTLPLYVLEAGRFDRVASAVSCGQDIAGDGAFSVGMLAEFEPLIRSRGPWFYRRLFWETGMIGQVLYLEAEAAGVRSTGIGCYFDDPAHERFGLEGRRFQSLYHFTVGGPVDDTRLTTLPPYPESRRRTIPHFSPVAPR